MSGVVLPDPLWPEHLRALEEVRPVLLRQAFEAYEKGVSHRGFRVGVAAFAWNSRKEKYFFCTGSNYKPKPGKNGPRCCAEEEACICAYMQKGLIVGLVIVGDYQRDDESGIPFRALLPCKSCRKKFHTYEQRYRLIRQETVLECMKVQDGRIVDSLSLTIAKLQTLFDE